MEDNKQVLVNVTSMMEKYRVQYKQLLVNVTSVMEVIRRTI